jgi:hypothetical protein
VGTDAGRRCLLIYRAPFVNESIFSALVHGDCPSQRPHAHKRVSEPTRQYPHILPRGLLLIRNVCLVLSCRVYVVPKSHSNPCWQLVLPKQTFNEPCTETPVNKRLTAWFEILTAVLLKIHSSGMSHCLLRQIATDLSNCSLVLSLVAATVVTFKPKVFFKIHWAALEFKRENFRTHEQSKDTQRDGQIKESPCTFWKHNISLLVSKKHTRRCTRIFSPLRYPDWIRGLLNLLFICNGGELLPMGVKGDAWGCPPASI